MSCPSDLRRIELLESEIESLKAMIRSGDNPYREGPIKLTPQLAELLNVLMENDCVERARALHALTLHSHHGRYADKEREASAVQVAVTRLRKALEPAGAAIRNRSGIGYLIDEADKRKIRELFRASNHEKD